MSRRARPFNRALNVFFKGNFGGFYIRISNYKVVETEREVPMVIFTEVACALYCPDCGSLEVYNFSLFSLGRNGFQLRCPCGCVVLDIERQKGKELFIRFNCVICGDWHSWSFHRWENLGRELFAFFCEDMGLEAGYLGPRPLVQQATKQLDRTLTELAADLGLLDGRWI